MAELIQRLAGLPFAPVIAWPVGDHAWAGLGLGDLLLATVFPLIMRKAYGTTAGMAAMLVALGVIGGLLLLGSLNLLGSVFPVMVALGPAMVLQYAFWRSQRGVERTTMQFHSSLYLWDEGSRMIRAASTLLLIGALLLTPDLSAGAQELNPDTDSHAADRGTSMREVGRFTVDDLGSDWRLIDERFVEQQEDTTAYYTAVYTARGAGFMLPNTLQSTVWVGPGQPPPGVVADPVIWFNANPPEAGAADDFVPYIRIDGSINGSPIDGAIEVPDIAALASQTLIGTVRGIDGPAIGTNTAWFQRVYAPTTIMVYAVSFEVNGQFARLSVWSDYGVADQSVLTPLAYLVASRLGGTVPPGTVMTLDRRLRCTPEPLVVAQDGLPSRGPGAAPTTTAHPPAGSSVYTRQPARANRMELIGGTGVAPSDMAIQGSYAYLSEPTGFTVLDISRPTRPVAISQIGRASGTDERGRVEVTGRTAYVMAGGELRTIDISDPRHPIQIGAIASAGALLTLSPNGTHAYISHTAPGGSGVAILDLASPTQPTEIGFFPVPDVAFGPAGVGGNAVVGAAVVGSNAYLVDFSHLRILDVANPAAPRQIGACRLFPEGTASLGAIAVTVAGDFAYVVDGFGLRVIDVSDANNPREIGYSPTEGSAFDFYTPALTVVGSYAYIAENPGLRIVDISDPALPVQVGLQQLGRSLPSRIAITGQYAYIVDPAHYARGLRIVDISNPGNPSLASSYGLPGRAEGLTIQGSRLLVGAGTAGLSIVDVADPAAPRETRGFGGSVLGNAVARAGSILYMGNPVTGLNLVDLADAVEPKHLSGPPELGEGRFPLQGLTMLGDRAYAVGHRSGGTPSGADSHFTVLDVSDPPRPRVLGRLPIGGTATKVAVSGNRAYIAAGEAGLLLMDISNPVSPVQLGSYTGAGAVHAVTSAGSYSYVLTGERSVRILDTSNAARIRQVGTMDLPSPFHLRPAGGNAELRVTASVQGNRLYVAAGEQGVRVIDVSDPTRPVEIGSFDTPGRAVDILVDGANIYVADEVGGVHVLRLSAP
jgi:hypothetical protein